MQPTGHGLDTPGLEEEEDENGEPQTRQPHYSIYGLIHEHLTTSEESTLNEMQINNHIFWIKFEWEQGGRRG